MTSPPRMMLRWRLRPVLDASRLKTTTGLMEALQRGGVPVSRTNLLRLLSGPPKSINLALLEHLCRALACAPQDILDWVPVSAQEKPTVLKAIRDQSRARVKKGQTPDATALKLEAPRLSDEERRKVVGPPIRALAAHPLARRNESKP